jgi:hypothetical protein
MRELVEAEYIIRLYIGTTERKVIEADQIYRVGHEKVARLLFAFAFGYCIKFCIYAMLRTQAIFCDPPCITLVKQDRKSDVGEAINQLFI